MIRSIAILGFVFSSALTLAKEKPKAPAPPPPQKQLPTGTILRPPETVMTNFVLHGIPGAGQTAKYAAYAYTKRKDGTLVKYSLSGAKDCELEKPCALIPGPYVIRYSNTDAYIEMLPDQPNEFTLQRFVVPKIDGKHYFRIFMDLTNPDEQKKFLSFMILNQRMSSYIEYTPMTSWVGTYLKPIFDSGDIKTASQTLFKELFDFRGGACQVAGGGSGTLTGSCYLSWAQEDPADGNFVSVMPGVYGVEWTLPDGKIRYQYGLVPQ